MPGGSSVATLAGASIGMPPGTHPPMSCVSALMPAPPPQFCLIPPGQLAEAAVGSA